MTTATPNHTPLLPPLPAPPVRELSLFRRLAGSWTGAIALHLLLLMGCVAFGAALPGTFGQRHGSGPGMPLVQLVSLQDAGSQGKNADNTPSPQGAPGAGPDQGTLPPPQEEHAVQRADVQTQQAQAAPAVPGIRQKKAQPPQREKTTQKQAPPAAAPAGISPAEVGASPVEASPGDVQAAHSGKARQGSGVPGREGGGEQTGTTGGAAPVAGGDPAGTAPDQAVPFGQPTGPAYKSRIQVEYPAQALRQQLTGKVLLRVRIAASGQVESVEVISSSHTVFVRAAEKAVREATFRPLMQGGKALPCWTVLPVEFRIAG